MIKAALLKHGIRAFVITSHKGNRPQLVELIINAWDECSDSREKIIRHLKILADGRITVIESSPPKNK